MTEEEMRRVAEHQRQFRDELERHAEPLRQFFERHAQHWAYGDFPDAIGDLIATLVDACPREVKDDPASERAVLKEAIQSAVDGALNDDTSRERLDTFLTLKSQL